MTTVRPMTEAEIEACKPIDVTQLLEAAQRFVALSGDAGFCATWTAGQPDEKAYVKLGCQSLEHAQDLYDSLINLVAATREINYVRDPLQATKPRSDAGGRPREHSRRSRH